MTKDVASCSPATNAAMAAETMWARDCGILPVLEDSGRVVGVVTEKMLLKFSPEKATSLDTWEVHYLVSKTPVKEAMNPKPHIVSPETDIRDAAKLLHDRKLNGVLVLNAAGDLVGIFTTTNALEALIDICDAERKAALPTAGGKA